MSYATDTPTTTQSQTISSAGSQTFTLMNAVTKNGMHAAFVCVTVVTANAIATATVTLNYTRNGVAVQEVFNGGVAFVLTTANKSYSKLCALYPDVGSAITLTVAYTGVGGAFAVDYSVRPPR